MTDATFDNYGLPAKLTQSLARNKFTTPTPIQAQTIPLALEGKDILGSAQTGTGKTAAFGIPVIAGLMNDPEAAALIMCPTRELAVQVVSALELMIPTADIRTALLIGGDPMPKQMNQLRHNPRLIVGTPGRINDHLERGSVKLGNVRFLVLDETDRMLDMGFGIQIERILKHVSNDRQTLLFSATLPSNITKLSGKYMRDPVRVAVGSTTTPAANIKQEVIPVNDAEKYSVLVAQLDKRKGSVIIFVKTKHGTEKLAVKLNRDNHKSDAIHGDLQQRRRTRVIENFRDKKFRILVATDVAARGLDIPHIEHVINYDMPQMPEDYIHRIGRTARAGAEGEAVSFLTGADTAKWRAIQRLLGGDNSAEPQRRGGGGGGARRGFGGGGGRGFGGGDSNRGGGRGFGGGGKPAWKRDGDASRGEGRGERSTSDRPRSDRPFSDKPRGEKTWGDKPRGERPHGDKPFGEKKFGEKKHFGDKPRGEKTWGDKPRGDRPHSDRPHSDRPRSERPHGEHKKSDWAPSDRARGDRFNDDKKHSDRPHSDKPRGEKSYGEKKAWGDKPRGDKPWGDKKFGERKSFGDKPRGDRPAGDRPHSDKPRSERTWSDKPRSEKTWGDKPRSDKPHSDKPRGDRPEGKKFGGKFAGKPAGRKFGGRS